jgi:hypothetical protein
MVATRLNDTKAVHTVDGLIDGQWAKISKHPAGGEQPVWSMPLITLGATLA